ncbi:di-trans,poly-cis-decaprenylcistransferase [Candidatus Pacearchaeota archaeon]|jgi:tritrans,polycis-undecaprenyl-diphosphate synthase [geranylgeranyl-diphosphate specific]|nr:di-trans,poly-cis-decaprenylcistransferase [Candidatus Pacearchaeota archaeon]|tara:strand:- start:707 stop:1396 length:690 start_codon:yes stop_codon:yes gene_type:complete
MEISNPKHVAIVLDGNRRFAKRLMLEPWKGHELGKEKVEKLLDYAKELGIKEMTFYALSVENINSRPSKELNFLYKIFREMFRDMDREKMMRDGVRMKFIGDLDLLPEDVRDECLKLEKDTADNDNFIVNFAVAYGGRQELIEAVKKIIGKKVSGDEVTAGVIEDNLYLSSEPDFIIRTGGEKRTSNFLPWQASYSEWFFLDKMWPEFTKEDLVKCIEEFKNRKRNFGK